jgi:hypothetical protein
MSYGDYSFIQISAWEYIQIRRNAQNSPNRLQYGYRKNRRCKIVATDTIQSTYRYHILHCYSKNYVELCSCKKNVLNLSFVDGTHDLFLH